jgi:hypothetical protein
MGELAVTDSPTATAPRSPVQNLLDEVDVIQIGVPVPDGYGGAMVYPVELDDEVKNHIKDLIRSAYATGRAHG